MKGLRCAASRRIAGANGRVSKVHLFGSFEKAAMYLNPRDRGQMRQAQPGDGQRGGSTKDRKEDRRSDRRYPITAELEYRIISRRNLVKIGSGRTLDISSTGVLFESAIALPRGLRIELKINWPALPSTTNRIEIRAEGRTVRATNNCTAVRIQKYTIRGVHSPALGGLSGTN